MENPKLKSRLAELLKERDMRPSHLAEKAGVTLRAVQGLRRNTAKLLDVHTTARICRALEVTPGDLFALEADPEPQ